jgi:hypothetical protein
MLVTRSHIAEDCIHTFPLFLGILTYLSCYVSYIFLIGFEWGKWVVATLLWWYEGQYIMKALGRIDHGGMNKR